MPPPLATYTGEKGRTLGKTYGNKWGAKGNTLGEHIGNLRNILGTKEKWKKSSSHPHPKLKWKKIKATWVPAHWLHVFLVAVGHHFGPCLLAGAFIEQGRKTKNNSPQHTQPPPLLRKKKTRAHLDCMMILPIGCMKLLFSKTVRHHFWPGLMAGSVIWVRTKLEKITYYLATTVTYAFFVSETNLHLIRLMFSAIHPRPNLPGRIASPLL